MQGSAYGPSLLCSVVLCLVHVTECRRSTVCRVLWLCVLCVLCVWCVVVCCLVLRCVVLCGVVLCCALDEVL